MAESEYTTVAFEPFKDFLESQDAMIDLLKIRFGKKGIEMGDLETWQYVAWGMASVMDVLTQLGGEPARRLLDAARTAVAPACASQYRQYRTGTLAPPMGLRFETPDEYYNKLPKPVSTETADHHKGYL